MSLPRGYDTTVITIGETVGAGYRSMKYVLAAPASVLKKSDRNITRKVAVGIDGSSMFETEARTSG